MWIRDEIIAQVDAKVRIGRVDRSITKYWNARRKHDDLVLLCGWFWVSGEAEGGPFMTQTAAYRDAFYRVVLGVEPPATPMSVPKRQNSRKQVNGREARP